MPCRWVGCTLDRGKDLALLLHPGELVVLALDEGASSAAPASWLAHRPVPIIVACYLCLYGRAHSLVRGHQSNLPGLKPAEASSSDKQPVRRRPTLALFSHWVRIVSLRRACLLTISEGCLHLRKINRVDKVIEGQSKDVLSRVSGHIANPRST